MAASSSTPTSLSDVDDFYFALINENERFPISDEKYALELQLQEAIMASISQLPLLHHRPLNAAVSMNYDATYVAADPGGPSGSFCEICMEGKPLEDMFHNNSCSHAFCSDCISKHIAFKIQEKVATVTCPSPECKGILEPEICRPIVPEEVFERWEYAISESLIPMSQRFYCPFKSCGVVLADDGGEVVRESECPRCRRLFCARCKVPWHSGVVCEEFQRLNEDERGKEDLMVMELASRQSWKRCPRCKFYVEKTEGCLHITCRCGFQFCYGCGLNWCDTHASCSRT